MKNNASLKSISKELMISEMFSVSNIFDTNGVRISNFQYQTLPRRTTDLSRFSHLRPPKQLLWQHLIKSSWKNARAALSPKGAREGSVSVIESHPTVECSTNNERLGDVRWEISQLAHSLIQHCKILYIFSIIGPDWLQIK